MSDVVRVKKVKRRAFTLLFLLNMSIHSSIFGQLSPPGLGNTNTASWFAIGFKQELDSSGQKESMTYFGMGRISDPAHYNPFNKAAILVINQEFYNQFKKHWQYSIALSYRRRNEYQENPPYEAAFPSITQEFRIYGRYSFIWETSRLKFTTTFRQEVRKFFTDGLSNYESLELRSRLRTKLSLQIGKKKKHELSVGAEALFSSSRQESINHWSRFAYNESRFTFYYSVSPENIPLTFDIGYMNNLIGTDVLKDAHYIAFDIVIKNLFGKYRSE